MFSHNYTTQQRIELLKIKYGCSNNKCPEYKKLGGKSFSETAQIFAEIHPEIDFKPTKGMVEHLVKKFNNLGSVTNKERKDKGKKRQMPRQTSVLQMVQNNPIMSTREMAKRLPYSKSAIWKILHNNLLKAYKITPEQQLDPDDWQKRSEFCSWCIDQMDSDPNFYRRIIFCDESIFAVNGTFNRQNHRYWARTNPHISADVNIQGGPSVMVWGGIWGDQVIGPKYFNGNVSGKSFKELLIKEVMPVIEQMPGFGNSIFLLDGAPGHWALLVRDYLSAKFPCKWIGRDGSKGGMNDWPPRSPDLTPLDFWLWGYVKNKVYKPFDMPQNIDDLKEKIQNAFLSVTPEMLQNVRAEWEERQYHCVMIGGKQFEKYLK